MAALPAELLDWYDVHARTLPWRVPPAESKRGARADPYHVWLSEVMLQQTTVKAVIPYFARFLALWPSVHDLAAAETETVMREWAGLGYYARARNMKACAEAIVAAHGGRFPDTEAGLRALPGVGAYTAAAIAAIAFGRRAAVVDGNVERVAARILADATPKPRLTVLARAWMEQHAPAASPQGRPGDFVQAVMDLGATICTPRRPACALCPVNGRCRAFARGAPLDFPVRAPKKARPLRRGAAFVARRGDGAVWTVSRPPSGLLGGMVAVPTTGWSARADGATGVEAAPFEAAWRHVGTARHGFTHFEIELEVFVARADAAHVDAAHVDAGWGEGARGEEAWGEGTWRHDPAVPALFAKVLNVAGGWGVE